MTTTYRIGEYELRPDERRLLAGTVALPLGGRAFDLLLVLVEQHDRVVGKDELLSRVWPGLVVEENNLNVQVSALRKALGSGAIATVPGRGYRLAWPVIKVQRAPAQEVGAPAPAAAVHDAPVVRAETADRPSIAVLPFEARSDDAAIAFLADGLVEDVIAQLARVPGFFVISRASSFEFRRREGLASVARQLGVRYAVEGSVREVGARLLVATHLVEAESGRVLWSGRHESARDSAGDLQEAIARGVIGELEPELTRAEITLIRRRQPSDLNAWAHYHRAAGAIALQGWNEQALAEARAQFDRALDLQPDFALAVAHRALLSALGIRIGLLPDTAEERAATCAAAERALALDDADSQVLGYAGCALADLGQPERGAEILQQALAIDPSNAQAHVALGSTQAVLGQWQAGIDRMRHGMLRSPRDRRLGFWGWALSMFLLHAGHTEEALAEARASARRDPKLYLPRLLEAAALGALGRAEEGRAALAAARRLRPALTLQELQRTAPRRAALIAPLWENDVPPRA